jgi:hypothetical protein
MKIGAAWIVLAMIFAYGSWGQSRPPTNDTKQSIPIKEKSGNETNKQNPANRRPEIISPAPSSRPDAIHKAIPAATEAGAADKRPKESWWDKVRADPNVQFNGLLVLFTSVLAVVSIWQGRLARQEFRATHRPKIGVRGFNIAFEGVTGDHLHPCSFTIFNEGSGRSFIREVNVVLIHDNYCWNQVNRRVQFRNPDTKDRVLTPGRDELYFTNKEFRWDDINSNWFLVGFVRYSDSAIGGIERKTGFCRRWVRPLESNIGAMYWAKENNEEYEYSY